MASSSTSSSVGSRLPPPGKASNRASEVNASPASADNEFAKKRRIVTQALSRLDEDNGVIERALLSPADALFKQVSGKVNAYSYLGSLQAAIPDLSAVSEGGCAEEDPLLKTFFSESIGGKSAALGEIGEGIRAMICQQQVLTVTELRSSLSQPALSIACFLASLCSNYVLLFLAYFFLLPSLFLFLPFLVKLAGCLLIIVIAYRFRPHTHRLS